jgi:hypothetical protein
MVIMMVWVAVLGVARAFVTLTHAIHCSEHFVVFFSLNSLFNLHHTYVWVL